MQTRANDCDVCYKLKLSKTKNTINIRRLLKYIIYSFISSLFKSLKVYDISLYRKKKLENPNNIE